MDSVDGGEVTAWDKEQVDAVAEAETQETLSASSALLMTTKIPSRPQTTAITKESAGIKDSQGRPQTGPSSSSVPSSNAENKEKISPPRPKTSAGNNAPIGPQQEESKPFRPKSTPSAKQYGIQPLNRLNPEHLNPEHHKAPDTVSEIELGETEQGHALVETRGIEVVERVMPTVSNRKPKGEFKLELTPKDGVWHKGRKVALMEHIHFKHTGKSLQEQISSIHKKVREHDELVNNLLERSATRGDLDALARTKADKSVLEKEAAINQTRVKQQLEEKSDLAWTESKLKTKVEWTGLKSAVSSFVRPLMFDIIAQKLPEAVEETKAGLVMMIQRMFEVDPEAKADMEAVKALRDTVEKLQKQIVISDRAHKDAVKGFADQVALVRAEVQESAEERLQEQIDFLNNACDTKLSDMTEKMEVLMETSKAQVKSSVASLQDKNARMMLRMQEEGSAMVHVFIEECKTEKKKFVHDVTEKYANDMKEIHHKVKHCERVCADANIVITALKSQLKQVEGFVKETTKRMTACEKQTASMSVVVEEYSKDFEDVRETEIQLRKDLSAVEGVFEKLTRSVDQTNLKVSNLTGVVDENFRESMKKLDSVNVNAQDALAKLGTRVRALEDMSKAGGRKIDLKIQDIERSFFDRLNIQAQQSLQDTKDVQKNVDKVSKELIKNMQKKTKEISKVDDACKKINKQFQASQHVQKEIKQELKVLRKVEVKVETLLEGMNKGNKQSGMALAALQRAEKLQEELQAATVQNKDQQQQIQEMIDSYPQEEPEPDPMVLQLEELQTFEQNLKSGQSKFTEKIQNLKITRKSMIKQMRDAKEKGDKVAAKQLQKALDTVDDQVETMEVEHNELEKQLDETTESIKALQAVVYAADGGSPPNHENAPSAVALPVTADSKGSEVVVSIPSVPQSRERLSSRASRKTNRSRGSVGGFMQAEIDALQAEIEAERNLRMSLEEETRDLHRTMNALLHTQESFREKIVEMRHMIIEETKHAVDNSAAMMEGMVENVKLKHIEEMEEQRVRLEKSHENMRRDQELMLKQLQESNRNLKAQLTSGGATFQMSSVNTESESDSMWRANSNQLERHPSLIVPVEDGKNVGASTNTNGDQSNNIALNAQIMYEANAQLVFDGMRDKYEEDMNKLRAEIQQSREHAKVGKIEELSNYITSLKKMHEESTKEHAKEIEKMHAQIASHNLKVESYAAIAEADQSDAESKQNIIDEQLRIMKELDIESLAKQLHEKVHEKLLAHVDFKCDDHLAKIKEHSENTLLKNKDYHEEHRNVLNAEAKRHVSSLLKASKEVQDTHQRHLSGHHDRILEMAETFQNQHTQHIKEVQKVVAEVHKSLTDINENSRYHMQKFQIQSQQVQIKIADLDERHERETAKAEYKHMREMRQLQNMTLEDRNNVRDELAQVRAEAENEHKTFLEFTGKLTHETEKMTKKFEAEMEQMKLRLENSQKNQLEAEKLLEDYARQETMRRISSLELPQGHAEDPFVGRARELNQKSLPADNRSIQKGFSSVAQFPMSPPSRQSRVKSVEFRDMPRVTAEMGPYAAFSMSQGRFEDQHQAQSGTRPNQPILHVATAPLLADGRDLDLFVNQTEIAMKNAKQLIVAVHERLSGEIQTLQQKLSSVVGADEFDSKIKLFWSKVGDLSAWKNKVVDLTEENDALLKELRRKSPTSHIFTSPKRRSKTKKKKELFRLEDEETPIMVSLPILPRKETPHAQETELRVEGNSMREETIAGFQQEEIPSNREAAAVQQFSLPHTPSGDEVPQNSNSLQSASPVLLPEI